MATEFERVSLQDGVDLHVKRSRQFKTASVSLFLHRGLSPRSVTWTALLPEVLLRGSRAYPSQRELSRRLDSLYGASVSGGVQKIGDGQAMYLSLDVLEDRYLPPGRAEGNFAAGLQLLAGLLLEPAGDGAAFREDYVSQETANLRKRIEGLINDKVQYATVRCIQEMFPDDPYGLHPQGRVEDLAAVDARALFDFYRAFLSRASADIFVIGDRGTAEVADLVREALTLPRDGVVARPRTQVAGRGPAPGLREVRERQAVNQGKLVLGYTTGVTVADEDHYPLLFYNGLLGGFVHSKLFREVRERASLAYYAHSRIDAVKGILLISCGIEAANYEAAREIIDRQLAAMARGDFTDEDLERTRRGLAHQFRALADSPGAQIGRELEGLLGGRQETLAERLASTAAVSREQVVAVAEKVRPAVVYFLAS